MEQSVPVRARVGVRKAWNLEAVPKGAASFALPLRGGHRDNCPKHAKEGKTFANFATIHYNCATMETSTKSQGLYINPLTDYGFKRIFGDREVMRAFLNDLLEPESEIVSVEPLNSEMPAEIKGIRGVTCDVRCKTDSGMEFIVEMQNTPQTEVASRILYYLSRAFSSQRSPGLDMKLVDGRPVKVKWDYKLRPVYCIFFMNFHLDGFSPRRTRTVKLKVEETGEVFTDTTRIYLLELPDYVGADTDSCGTKADEWLYNIANMSAMNTREIPFSDRQPAMKRMFTIAEVANMSPAEAESYNISYLSWMTSCDMYDTAQRKGMEKGLEEGMEKGLEKGMKKGLAEGEAKGKIEALTGIISYMLQHGVDVDEIERTTGIARETIEEVKRKSIC